MHELSVAEGILSTIEKQLGEVKSITRVNLTISPLAGISADSLRILVGRSRKAKRLRFSGGGDKKNHCYGNMYYLRHELRVKKLLFSMPEMRLIRAEHYLRA